MFNKSTWFKKKPKVNETLDIDSQNKVNETKNLLGKGDWSTAELIIKDLIQRHPNNADCCWLFGRLLANRSQYDAAIEYFKQCILLNELHSDCYCSYGATLGRIKRYNLEEEMYKKCLELNPSHHICHYNYGCLCEILSDYKNAEKHFKKAVELYSKDVNYYISYGKLLKTIRRYDEAQKHFEFAISLNHNNKNDKQSLANAYYQYGRLLQHMDRLNDAISYLKKACKLNPQNTEYQRILHIMVRSKPRKNYNIIPTLPKSQTVSPLLSNTNNDSSVMATISNQDTKKRSMTQEIIKPTLETPKNKQESNKQDYDEIDEYFHKAASLYKNKQYDEAETILKLVTMIRPNHEEANRLYKYLSQKMYINDNKEKPQTIGHNKIVSSPSILFECKEEDEELGDDELCEDKNSDKDPCQIEFIRFLSDRVKLNKQYPDLHQRFEKLGYDDIRTVFDFDKETLTQEIKIKPLHCKTFMRKIQVFKNEANVFREWLKKIVCKQIYMDDITSMDGLIDRLENKGILTFESFYRYILSKDDLIKIIGKQYTKISHILWKEIENQQQELMIPSLPSSSSSSSATPAFSTPSGPQMNAKGSINEGNNNNEGKVNMTQYIE